MLPARTDIVGSLVYLFLRQGDDIRARKIIEQSLVNGGDEAALKAARTALETFEAHVAARQSLYKARVTPEDVARDRAARERRIGELREALADTRDPERRALLESMLKDLESAMSTVSYNQAIKVFNEAVDRANKRDFAGAIALLEDLLPQVGETDLKDRIAEMLERFSKDATRLQQPVQ
jgi:hypothetical protein